MKILMLHNRYKIMGGEDVSTEAEVALLRDHGIHVEIVYVSNDIVDHENKFKLAINTIWSKKYYDKILNKILTEKFDIVHVQNFFPLLSPAIFHASKKAGAKVVMSVRNYRLICPNALLYINNKICTECVGKLIPYPSISKKCYRNSFNTTCVTTSMLGFHNILNTWKNKIDGLICISEFVKKQLIQGNFEEKQLHVKYNFVNPSMDPNFDPEDFYIYVGRISTEKGIDLLLKTFKDNKKKLMVLGDGPLKQEVIKASMSYNNIKVLGKLPLNETYKMISNAKALIFPSQWHEPFGRTIIEAFAHGTPVIGSSLGGITELIQDGYNGFLFDPNKPSDLSATIEKFEAITNTKEIRHNSYSSYQKHFTASSNIQATLNIYNKVLAS